MFLVSIFNLYIGDEFHPRCIIYIALGREKTHPPYSSSPARAHEHAELALSHSTENSEHPQGALPALLKFLPFLLITLLGSYLQLIVFPLMVFQNFRTLDLIFPFDWNFFFNIVSVKSEPYGGNYLTKKYYSHFRVVSFIQLLKRTERGFIFITSIYKEIITTEEQSPFEQTRENSSVLTAHTHQEGEHAVLVLSRVPVSYQMFAGDPN